MQAGNWEGVGVRPGVATPASDAIRLAQIRALSKLLKSTPRGLWYVALERQRAYLMAKQ